MKKIKTAKRSRNFQRSKRIGGILQLNTLVPAVDDAGYLRWNTIPSGTLVLLTDLSNRHPQGIWIVRGGPSLLSLYDLEHTETHARIRVRSENFRIIVQIEDAINSITGDIINRVFYGLITGYGTLGATQTLYVTGLDGVNNDTLIYNTYNGTNFRNRISVITYDDIVEEIEEAATLTAIMNNYISNENIARREQLINLRILNNQGEWILPNQGMGNMLRGWMEDVPLTSNPRAAVGNNRAAAPPGSAFANYVGSQQYGPNNPFGQVTSFASNPRAAVGNNRAAASPGSAFANYVGSQQYGPNNPFGQVTSFGQVASNSNRREARAEETIEQKEKRLDDWISEQNNKGKKKNDIERELKVASKIKKDFLKGILDGEKNDVVCPVCQEKFVELAADTSNNEIYACKNIHLICGNCKKSMDEHTKTDGYLWAHTTPVWKCIVCKNVSRNADRLEDYEEAYKEARKTYDPSKGGGKLSSMYKNVGKKEVLGKLKIIYKIKGSNKEYVKNKGIFVHITEYKNLKNKKK
jgi:rubrerythrin